jgi:hypothetical protein
MCFAMFFIQSGGFFGDKALNSKILRVVAIIATVCVLFTTISFAQQKKGDERLITALVAVESGGDIHAVGDNNLTNKAYGCLQIRQSCVDDVNRRCGTNYRAEDCLGNPELSVWMFHEYMAIYATEKRLGRKVTDQDKARIWNGGPNGFKKSSTKSYWTKVKKALENQ